ncbi:hypothetical protein BN1723_020803, partial [Verticillium longisporum]
KPASSSSAPALPPDATFPTGLAWTSSRAWSTTPRSGPTKRSTSRISAVLSL